MKTAVIFGAGNIGRGFIGQLFTQSGYEVTFVDIDRELLDHFNAKRGYELQTVYNDEVHDYWIAPVRGLLADQREAVAAAVAAADLAATSVGVRALPCVAPNLAAGIAQRAQRGAPPLNVILAENLKGASQIVRDQVQPLVPPAAREYFAASVGFVDSVIGRMVPPPEPALRAQHLGRIRVEPYQELPVDLHGFRGPIPTVASMTAHDNFPLFTARKLYIHNCGHALLAYRGWLAGFQLGYEALADRRIHDFVFAGWDESARGIVHHYGADRAWLDTHMQDLYRRFQNRALGDTIFRLGRDPVRKLMPTDRLVAPANLALAAGVTPVNLARGIAAAFRFAAPDDPVAGELQQRLRAEGLPALLTAICQIPPASALGRLVQDEYAALPAPAAAP